ncbi:MAG: hypothetical protein ACOYUZ_02215 [Patescibacteria group bacterium]
MDERLQKIFTYVIEQVIATGEPIGSQYLVDRYNLNISPATVRNYFAVLEKDGYIMQPHTSSGRIPTEKGYQYYIENILQPRILSKKENKDLESVAQAFGKDVVTVKALAKVAAELAQNAVIVSLAENDSYYTGLSHLFTQPEFKDWNRIVSMSDVLDRLDEVLSIMHSKHYDKPSVFLGNDCPFGSMCGTVITSLPGGYTFGILGPMRMDYGLSISIIKKIMDLLHNDYVDQKE